MQNDTLYNRIMNEVNIKKIALTINADNELVREDDNTTVSFNQLYSLVESGYFITLQAIHNENWERVFVKTSPLTSLQYNEGDNEIQAAFYDIYFIGTTLDSTLVWD